MVVVPEVSKFEAGYSMCKVVLAPLMLISTPVGVCCLTLALESLLVWGACYWCSNLLVVILFTSNVYPLLWIYASTHTQTGTFSVHQEIKYILMTGNKQRW